MISSSALVAPGICVATDPLALLLQAWAFAAYVAALPELVVQVNCAEADSQRGRGSCELNSSFWLCRHSTAFISALDFTARACVIPGCHTQESFLGLFLGSKHR